MAGTFSTYLEQQLLNLVFRNTAYGPLATTYVALADASGQSAAVDSSDGDDITTTYEISVLGGGNYARQAVASTDWSAPAAGTGNFSEISNNVEIQFPQASSDWGTITHFAIYDALTAGNLLCWGDLSTTKTINTNDIASFGVGQLKISLD